MQAVFIHSFTLVVRIIEHYNYDLPQCPGEIEKNNIHFNENRQPTLK